MRKIIKNWQEVFEQHSQSGKTIPEFCKEIGIHPNTFYKHKKRIGDGPEKSSEIIEIDPVQAAAAIPIVLKSKKFSISITTGFDECLLKSVLKIIGGLE
jgi:hypothetical protein